MGDDKKEERGDEGKHTEGSRDVHADHDPEVDPEQLQYKVPVRQES